MAKRIFVPIGKIFNYERTQLQVVASNYNNAVCTGCYFSDWNMKKLGKSKFNCYVHGYSCTEYLRKDKKHIIFKEIENI